MHSLAFSGAFLIKSRLEETYKEDMPRFYPDGNGNFIQQMDMEATPSEPLMG